MNTKISALFLLALLSLGVTGFASAWWTAELKVTGTVTTGTFGLEWSPLTYLITGDPKKIITGSVYLTDFKEDTKHPQTLAIELSDVYPCTDLEIKGDVHYYGTVPGHIKKVNIEGTLGGVALPKIPDWMFIRIEIQGIAPKLLEKIPELTVGSIWELEPLLTKLVSSQWHQSYYINFFVYIHWIETGMTITDPWGYPHGPFGADIEVPQGATLKFTITFDVEQYNHP